MKTHLRSLVSSASSTNAGLNLTREYLQARILASLQRSGAMIPLAFHGGTALRFLFDLPRYSEDLDFALEGSTDLYDFRRFLKMIRADLEREGYQIDLKVNDSRTVHNAFVRFPGLPFELDLSPHQSQTLSVKIEVDTNPPVGAGLSTTIIRRHVTLNLQHHDKASLLAGKLHAVLARPYTKGRDLYDLFWYLSDPTWPEPNVILLQNALRQTDWKGEYPTATTWRSPVVERLQSIEWSQAIADVQPFLEPHEYADLLTQENLLSLLTQK